MTLAQQAAEALAGLGETPDEIAAMLLGAGYRGRTNDAYQCPCGSCLKDHLGISVAVGSMRLTVAPKDSHSLAPQVANFIDLYDAGKYPELVQP